jgi:hypothetical protein
MQFRGTLIDAQPDAPLRFLFARIGPSSLERIIGKEPLKYCLAVLVRSGASRQDGQIGRQNPTGKLKIAVESDFNRIPATVFFQDSNFEIGVIHV